MPNGSIFRAILYKVLGNSVGYGTIKGRNTAIIKGEFCFLMSYTYHFGPAIHAQIGGVPWTRTPDYVNPQAAYPWRTWHHTHFGGSPIPVCFAGNLSHLGPSRVELGDLHHPDLEGIVNLCELDDVWPLGADDRRWPRGEGMFGYTWERLDDDARDIADLIRAGKRVLIHCMAGVNR